MSRQEIIKKLKENNPKLEKRVLENIIDVFSESLAKALVEGKSCRNKKIRYLFTKKIKEKYSARNPKTGEYIYVPQKNKVRFRPSKKLKEIINK